MADLATQRLARQVRRLRAQNNWLAVGMLVMLVLQAITLGCWIDYEVRVQRLRQSLPGLQSAQHDLQDAQRLMGRLRDR